MIFHGYVGLLGGRETPEKGLRKGGFRENPHKEWSLKALENYHQDLGNPNVKHQKYPKMVIV